MCVGGLMRDYKGVFLKAYAVRIGGKAAFMAEDVGLLQGLTIAHQMKIPKLEIELDALDVIQVVATEDPRAT